MSKLLRSAYFNSQSLSRRWKLPLVPPAQERRAFWKSLDEENENITSILAQGFTHLEH
jgi:hypothetical protein